MVQPWLRGGLEFRLVVVAVATMLLFALGMANFTYLRAYNEQQQQAEQLQHHLVRTVKAQAEVALFARNEIIANDVVEGLMANPMILAVRLVDSEGILSEKSRQSQPDFSDSYRYQLTAPFNRDESVGELRV